VVVIIKNDPSSLSSHCVCIHSQSSCCSHANRVIFSPHPPRVTHITVSLPDAHIGRTASFGRVLQKTLFNPVAKINQHNCQRLVRLRHKNVFVQVREQSSWLETLDVKVMWKPSGQGLLRVWHTVLVCCLLSPVVGVFRWFFHHLSPLYIAAASLVSAPSTASYHTHTHLSFSPVSLSPSTCSMVHWMTVNPIRGHPSAPPPPPQPHYLALIHQRGSQAVHHPAITQSPIHASAQCCSRGPSWGTARAWSLSDDG